MHRTKLEEGGPQLSAADARKNIMRAHVVALMLDAEEVGVSTCRTSYSRRNVFFVRWKTGWEDVGRAHMQALMLNGKELLLPTFRGVGCCLSVQKGERVRKQYDAPECHAHADCGGVINTHVAPFQIVASGALMKMDEITLASWVLEEGRALIVSNSTSSFYPLLSSARWFQELDGLDKICEKVLGFVVFFLRCVCIGTFVLTFHMYHLHSLVRVNWSIVVDHCANLKRLECIRFVIN
jgi:hypothetical protein